MIDVEAIRKRAEAADHLAIVLDGYARGYDRMHSDIAADFRLAAAIVIDGRVLLTELTCLQALVEWRTDWENAPRDRRIALLIPAGETIGKWLDNTKLRPGQPQWQAWKGWATELGPCSEAKALGYRMLDCTPPEFKP